MKGKTILRKCRKGPETTEDGWFPSRVSRSWEHMGHTFATVRPLVYGEEQKQGWLTVHVRSGLLVDSFSWPTRDEAEEAAREKMNRTGQQELDRIIDKAEVVNEEV